MPSFGGNPGNAAPAPHSSGGFFSNLGHAVSAPVQALPGHNPPPSHNYGFAGALGHAISNVGSALPGHTAPVHHYGLVGALSHLAQSPGQAISTHQAQRAQAQQYFNNAQAASSEAAVKSLVAAANKPIDTGGGLSIAGIHIPLGAFDPTPALHDLGTFASNIPGSVASLPGKMVTGTGQLAAAAWDDLTHSHLGTQNWGPTTGPSETGQLLKAGFDQSVIGHLVKGDLSGAGNTLMQDPASGIMELSGEVGALGRVAGGAARVGMFGDKAANFAKLGHTVNEVAPGIPGTGVMQHVSPNLFKQIGSDYLGHHPSLVRGPGNVVRAALNKAHPGLGARVPTAATQALKKQVALVYGPVKSQIARDVTAFKKATKAEIKPLTKAEQGVVQYTTGFGMGTRADLVAKLNQLKNARAGAEGPIGSQTAKTLDSHIQNLEAALAKPHLNEPALQAAAQGYGLRQVELQAQKHDLGLTDAQAMDRALMKQYAVERVPGATWLDKPVLHPDYVVAKRAAGSELRAANATLREVQSIADKTHGAHKGASAVIADATRRLPVHPVTDNLANHLTDIRTAIEQSRAEQRGISQMSVGAAQDAVRAAQQHYNLLKSNPQKLDGLVIHDPTANPIPSGKLQGLPARQLTSDEIKAHIATNPVAPSYINMTNPERLRPLTLSSSPYAHDVGGASSATGKALTGRASLTGDWLPGHVAMARSQLNDIYKIGSAKLEQGFIQRFGMKDANGVHFTPHNAWDAANAYEAAHGIKMVPLADRAAGADKLVLVPKAAVDEFNAQRALERPTPLGRVGLAVNRAFRNTVLPMSPKLPIMHTVENAVRGGIAGANPQTYMLGRAIKDALAKDDPLAANRLNDLTTPGGMGGHLTGLGDENLGRVGHIDRSLAGKVLSAPGHYWAAAAHGIIGFQRWIEKHAQTAVLGVHAKQTLRELGVSALDANFTIHKYENVLAQGYKDPMLAEDAARLLHRTMGQYNNYTAGTRMLVSRVMPFAPWGMNAAKLIFRELPLHSPLRTALVQDIANANQPAWDKTHKGLPPDMQSSLVIGPNHYLDVGKFGPFGIEKNPIETIAGLLLPQYKSAGLAMAGLDPFYGQFKGPHTPYGKAAVAPVSSDAVAHALDAFGQGVLGPIGPLAQALQSHGETLYNTSMPLFGQVDRKAGTAHGGPGGILGGLERRFNPFYGTYFGGNRPGSVGSTAGQAGTTYFGPGGSSVGSSSSDSTHGLFSGTKR